jgi:hypothetical protein
MGSAAWRDPKTSVLTNGTGLGCAHVFVTDGAFMVSSGVIIFAWIHGFTAGAASCCKRIEERKYIKDSKSL